MPKVISHSARHKDDPIPEILRGASTALISDCNGRDGCLGGVVPIARPAATMVAGRAFTIRVRPGDNLAVHEALEAIPPGVFVVIDGEGYPFRAVIGEILVAEMQARGAVGVAVHGAVRDIDDLADAAIPVFASARSPLGPLKDGPGEVGGTVAVHGCQVRPGDAIFGDGDGIVVVAVGREADVAAGVEERRRMETDALAKARAREAGN